MAEDFYNVPYVMTRQEIAEQEIAVLGGSVTILEGCLRECRKAAIRNSIKQPVAGLMFKATKMIREIDADTAWKFGCHLCNRLNWIQDHQHPWTAEHAIPFLEHLIQDFRGGYFEALLKRG